jgi:hypothetical protein
MPKSTRVTDKVFARIEEDLAEGINAIHEKHHIEPAVLVRGLLEAAVSFYRDKGFFSFPVVIHPEAFQARWVAETQAEYQHGPTKGGAPPGKGLDKSRRRRGAGPAASLSRSA